jgi:subtilase family serine protease
MLKRFGRSVVSAVALGGLTVSACSTTSTPAPAKSQQSSQTPSWATSDNYIGQVPAGDQIAVQVHLKLRNEAQADVELAAIGDPSSPMYGKFLSDEQYDAMHAPAAADVIAVRKHLEANGLSVTYVPANRAFVAATGTAAQVQAAFGTQLSLYNVGGEVRRAAVKPYVLPATFSSSVLTVAGLTQGIKMKPHSQRVGLVKRDGVYTVAKAKGLKGGKPADVPANTCSEWFGQVPDVTDPALPGYPQLSYTPCGYRPGIIRDLYGLSAAVRSGNDGTGQTVAILDAYLSPTLLSDAQTYAFNQDPDYPLGSKQLTTVWGPGTQGDPDTGWYGEQTLDVEAVHAVAPGANIVAVAAVSDSDNDLAAAMNMIIDKKLATIISNSWGEVEYGNNYVLWNHILKTASLKGIGVYFSSGDNGDESGTVGFPVPDYPASSDLVTAVGGTSAAMGPTGALKFESGWETSASLLLGTATDGGVAGDGGAPPMVYAWDPPPPGFFVFGSGGGTSYVFDQPAWQVGIVPAALANIPGVPARVVPDVAMLADPFTGMLIGQTDPNAGVYSEYAIGGTSLACPLFAGTMALAQQNAKKTFGFANATLYAASKKGAFRDIAPISPEAVALPADNFGDPAAAIMFDFQGQAIQTAKGYDNVTGLGVPNGAKFLANVK